MFYKPIGQYNQHPGYTNVTDGDKHLAELVTKLQNSAAYQDMLILITWDENGGQWDHVPPPRRDRWGPGTRIPLVAVGPTVKHGYIDHTPYDFGSILRTIEVAFRRRAAGRRGPQCLPDAQPPAVGTGNKFRFKVSFFAGNSLTFF